MNKTLDKKFTAILFLTGNLIFWGICDLQAHKNKLERIIEKKVESKEKKVVIKTLAIGVILQYYKSIMDRPFSKRWYISSGHSLDNFL